MQDCETYAHLEIEDMFQVAPGLLVRTCVMPRRTMLAAKALVGEISYSITGPEKAG